MDPGVAEMWVTADLTEELSGYPVSEGKIMGVRLGDDVYPIKLGRGIFEDARPSLSSQCLAAQSIDTYGGSLD